MAENSSTHPRVLRLRQVQDRVGLSRSTIYDRLDSRSSRFDEDFPRPIKIGKSAVGWVQSEVAAYVEKMIRRSREEFANS